MGVDMDEDVSSYWEAIEVLKELIEKGFCSREEVLNDLG
jgi:hypothetical protein